MINLKRNDMLLIGIVFLIGAISYFVIFFLSNDKVVDDGVAIVYYYDDPILEISLQDGSYNIINDTFVINVDEGNNKYIVKGTNGDVEIEYNEYRVRVTDEISPKNICQKQSWSSSPLKPITCLPNNILILVKEREFIPADIDGISG